MIARSAWRVHLRLGATLVAVAVLSVVIASVAIGIATNNAIRRFGREDLALSAGRVAAIAADYYTRDGRGWTRAKIAKLARLERIEAETVVVRDAGGAVVPGSMTGQATPRASAPVLVDGRRVGNVSVAHVGGGYLRARPLSGGGRGAPDQLVNEIGPVRFAAAALAALLALAVAVAVTLRLSRPVRRLTEAAEQIESGLVDVKVDVGRPAIPELGRLASTMQRVASTLKRQEEIRKETVSDLAHELRTPVTGLRARIEAVQDGLLTDMPAALSSMHDDVMRLSRLVDDFQRLAAAQRPGLLLDKAHVDLTQLVRSRARAFESSYAEKGIDLMVDVDPAYTLGDAERLGQVVDNLLSNALRYTDAGGRVVLRLIEDDGHVLIEVADTGMGIPKEQLPRIFDRFWRSDKSRSRATGGSGLGLALVRELVVAHDGRVDVLSAPGHGSRFRVFLPRAGRQYVPAVRFSHVPVPEAPGGEATVASVPADLEPDGWARVERDLVSAVGHGAAVLVVVVPGSGPLDPSGVAALLAVSAQLKARGGRLAVVREDRRSTPAVRGLDDVLFVEDVDAALAQLAA